VVVGGGPIAEGKVRNLMKHPCEVVLISPEATVLLTQWAGEGRIEWERRAYREGDLKGAFLAIGATGVPEVDRQMAEEAERERVLLNVVDYVPLCMFIAPSIVERGPVTFAISTSGASPALARKLRESMEKSELLDFAEIAGLLSKARAEVKRRGWKIPPDRWQQVIDRNLVEAVRQGREEEALVEVLQELANSQELK
jgi:precorrin-2 dehydrogenase/sirohydrochlorin ferrochelatase